MIYLLKALLIIMTIIYSGIIYYIYNQFKLFSSSEESEGLSILNNLMIKLIVWIVLLVVLFLIGTSGYFIFSKITIG